MVTLLPIYVNKIPRKCFALPPRLFDCNEPFWNLYLCELISIEHMKWFSMENYTHIIYRIHIEYLPHKIIIKWHAMRIKMSFVQVACRVSIHFYCSSSHIFLHIYTGIHIYTFRHFIQYYSIKLNKLMIKYEFNTIYFKRDYIDCCVCLSLIGINIFCWSRSQCNQWNRINIKFNFNPSPTLIV